MTKRKPTPVLFGDLECDAIEIIDGPIVCGLYIKVHHRSVQYHGRRSFDVDVLVATVRRGELHCDTCDRPWYFAEDGQMYTFPFSPLPGWFVWYDGVLSLPAEGEPQEIKPHVRCDQCAAAMRRCAEKMFAEMGIR